MPEFGTRERRTAIKTVRLTESSARSLENEAADGGTTVNALINSIIRQRYEWDKKARESGFASIQKSVLKALVEGLDDRTLARIGREVVPGWFEQMAEYWYQDSSPDRILEAVSLRFKFDPLMRVKITKEGGAYAIVLRHDLGPKWSILAESTCREIAKQFFHAEPRITRGESMVTTRFKVNPRNSPTTLRPQP